MKKYIKDLHITAVEHPAKDYLLLRLTAPTAPLPPVEPGQFVEIAVDGAQGVLLRRPISINYVDSQSRELWLLVHQVGSGTRALGKLRPGDTLNIIFPLGRGFALPEKGRQTFLLVGGGVGTAPLLYYGSRLRELGHTPIFLLGGRSEKDLLQRQHFEAIGQTCYTTEDGSLGEKGFVTAHTIWQTAHVDRVATCGPKPMMVAVARMAAERHLPCQASLENLMACGLGACLCCVEKTQEGHLCVCKEGPVFDTDRLLWLN